MTGPGAEQPHRRFDLNTLRPAWAAKARQGFDWARTRRDTTSAGTTVHFGNLTDALLEFVRGSEAVVGCVAWITSRDIVHELAQRPVALIVNKEWSLRSTDRKASSARQRALLATLHGGLRRRDFPKPLSDIPTGDDSMPAVRCVGHTPRTGAANTPLMHSKFLVRLQHGKPVAVWTGSFNFTGNAANNVENAVEIHHRTIARAYLNEFARVAALSEPLEFKAGKADPAWTGAEGTSTSATPPAAKPPRPTTAAAPRTGSRAHTKSQKPRTTRSRRTTSTAKKGKQR
ncbi:phospholipase D-like domain-containing protein [Curtobacterium sp. MCBD17_040]|uniref:phospholipase D-like domain-containing protein n=1 Tax=Curtobacterium sp. MCBD17_040 TaxID=2175674 RepID=UPI0015E8AC20|nr:phospholipase D-like domain-containing protein [Curtobacterium sp. MCBD17_040]WIB65603.1 phospholipase D-like domain-containing protein [Curtobacterium sp. MCBD17_040]